MENKLQKTQKDSRKSHESKSHESKKRESCHESRHKSRESKKRESCVKSPESHKSNESKSRILFLAKNEREKSLFFYESLQKNPQMLDENLSAIITQIAQKEREMLDFANKIYLENSRESNHKSNRNLAESKNSEIAPEIILPSALPCDILGDLINEVEVLDAKSLNILALGVESHHLKTCDFLIKKAQEISQNAPIIDILYRFQALSFNHHIPLLNGESPKDNAHLITNQNSANPSPNSAIANENLLGDLLKQNPLFNEIKTSLDLFQNFYNETKNIVYKLEKGELGRDELVTFLQKLKF